MMKRYLTVLGCFLIVALMFVACSSFEYETSTEDLRENQISSIFSSEGVSLDESEVYNILVNYNYFSDKYKLEEYCDLIIKLRTATGEQSLLPEYPINEKLLFVSKIVSTYNENTGYFGIVDINGEIKLDWNSEWRYYDIVDSVYNDFCIVPCGFSTYDGAVGLCDVINMEGEKIATIKSSGVCFELGKDYILCSAPGTGGGAVIVHSSGENYVVDGFGIEITGRNYVEEDAYVGQLSEGLWGTIVDRGNRGVFADYYNVYGEKVIDLSQHITNYKITTLGLFENGQARIELIGANGKKYFAFIDTNGKFVKEPVEITE